jgi:hypothetical protein
MRKSGRKEMSVEKRKREVCASKIKSIEYSAEREREKEI